MISPKVLVFSVLTLLSAVAIAVRTILDPEVSAEDLEVLTAGNLSFFFDEDRSMPFTEWAGNNENAMKSFVNGIVKKCADCRLVTGCNENGPGDAALKHWLSEGKTAIVVWTQHQVEHEERSARRGGTNRIRELEEGWRPQGPGSNEVAHYSETGARWRFFENGGRVHEIMMKVEGSDDLQASSQARKQFLMKSGVPMVLIWGGPEPNPVKVDIEFMDSRKNVQGEYSWGDLQKGGEMVGEELVSYRRGG